MKFKFKNFNSIQTLFFGNITIKQTIFKNTFWLMVGNGGTKVLNFILLIYVARILGATEYGKFAFALAFTALFAMFADLGISTIIIREFAKEKEREKELYSLLSLKILLGIGTLILILISSFLAIHDPVIKKIILILAFYVVIENLNGIGYSFFQARQKMEYQAGLTIFGTLLLTIFGFFILFKFPSAQNLSYAYLFANFITLICIYFFFHYKVFSLKILWDRSVWQRFLSMSWPLAFTAMLITVYNYTDSVMLGFWGKITETGWYNAAYRIAWVSFFITSPICGSFYPILSKYFKESKEKLQKIWNYFMELMIIMSFPLVVGGITLAPRIINFIYGPAFAPSILAFQILIVMAGIIFLYVAFQQTLIVFDQQKKLFWATFGGALTNVILNAILIPKYSLYGAAVATVITHILIFFLLFRFTLKFTSINPFNLRFLYILIGTILSTLIMFFVISYSRIYYLNVFLSITIGIAVYFVCMIFYRKLTNRLLTESSI